MTGFDLTTIVSGVIITVVGAIIGNYIKIWYYKPKLKISTTPLKVRSNAEYPVLREIDGTITESQQRVIIFVYRVEVINEGKTAARNVRGTIEFNDNQPERRICWYEEGNVPFITINSNDHSFLDVYGVIIERNRITNKILIPTENGWMGLTPIPVTSEWILKIRVTAEDVKPERKKFKINPNNNCELEFIP